MIFISNGQARMIPIKEKESVMSQNEVPTCILTNLEKISMCNEMRVTVGGLFYKGSFSVLYSDAGKVISLEEPYFWD